MKIYQRKDGRWQFNYRQKMIDGTTKPKSIIHKDKEYVKKHARITMYELEDCYDLSNVKLKDYMHEWFELHKKKIAVSTQETYSIYINKHIMPHIGNLSLNKITMFSVQKLLNDKSKDYKTKTLKHIKSVLSRALEDAVKNKLIKSNPCQYADIPKLDDDYQYTIYNEEDYDKLYEYAKETTFELPVVLSALCGLRRSEVFGLTWDDIDYTEKLMSIKRAAVVVSDKVVIKTAKNKSSIRTVSVPDEALEILKSRRGIGYICNKEGNPINGRVFSKDFKVFLERNNLKLIRFHDLRHFHATYLMSLGVDIKLISSRLGHSLASTTQNIYQHVTPVMDKIIAEKINKKRKLT